MQSLWTHYSLAELENHYPRLVRCTYPAAVVVGLALDRPQAQEYGDRSSDHIPVHLFTLEFIYGLDSPTPYPLREIPHYLIWFSITPMPASSRRDRGMIDLAG